MCSLMQTHTHSIPPLTCMVEEMLERERPSRSESRLEEMTEDGSAFVGAGETKRTQKTDMLKPTLNRVQLALMCIKGYV